MKKLTLAIMAAAVLAGGLSGCASDGTVINDNGTTDQAQWHEWKESDMDSGIYPAQETLAKLHTGMTKREVLDTLDIPTYANTGIIPRQYNYIFHFKTPDKGKDGVTTCQFKVTFDKDGLAQGFYWHPVSAERGACDKSPYDVEEPKQEAVPQETEKTEAKAEKAPVKKAAVHRKAGKRAGKRVLKARRR